MASSSAVRSRRRAGRTALNRAARHSGRRDRARPAGRAVPGAGGALRDRLQACARPCFEPAGERRGAASSWPRTGQGGAGRRPGEQAGGRSPPGACARARHAGGRGTGSGTPTRRSRRSAPGDARCASSTAPTRCTPS
jgi:hypothetical protein